ncbi:AMP-binding protein [Lentisalinibacter sediminis]|uniref:AMP-binding protein n=1 Tax=Lentisalinibacter sediminis TaxID=2992237 RepID=UPI00386C68FA
MNESLTLSSLFEELGGHGEHPAVVEADGGDNPVLTYRELADRIPAVAIGADADGYDRVALFATPDADWISVFLGLLRAGITAVPIDTQMEREQLGSIFADTDIPCVVADEERASILQEIDYDGTVLRLDRDGGARSWQRWLNIDGDAPDLPGAEDTALLLFTSGTTGPPKGVPLKHRNLAFQVRTVEETGLVAADDCMLQPLPLHHVYPLVIGTLAPLSLGIPIVIPASLTGPDIIRAIRSHDVTIILGVPRLYAALLAGVDARIDGLPAPVRLLMDGLIRGCTAVRRATGVNAGRYLLRPLHRQLGPTLRMLASGGSPLDAATAHRLEGIGWDVAIGYGLTETAPLLTIKMPGRGHLDTVGRVVDGIELSIDRSVQTASDADAGEILVRGPGVFEGYLDREDETRESFTDGWFRTGDLGRIDDDGYLQVLGRKSTMLVTASGENIRTEALEEAYAEHPLIAEIGILKDGEQLAAVIFPDLEALRRESRSAEDAIGAAVRERSRSFPSYQRLDRYRVTHEPLDRTRLDKIRRNKLEERYESLADGEDAEGGEPMAIDDMAAEDRELLRNERARKAWELLAERYRRMRLTPDTSFQLELGVDSLGWLDLSMDIARRTGAELREDDIAGIETVRDMLAAVAEKEESVEELHTPLEQPDSVLTDEQKEWLEPRSRASAITARAAYAVNTGLMRAAFRVSASGEPPPESGPLLIAPNHASFLDPFVLAATLPPDLRVDTFWGGWTGWAYSNAVFRGFSRLGRVIPIDPRRTVVSSLAFAKSALDRNRVLVWFPEGERSRDGELQPLRPGIGVLLEHAPEVTVLPVSIEGAFEAWPRGQRLPRPSRIVVRYGRGISVQDLHDRGAGENDRDRILDGLRWAIRDLQDHD